MKLDNLVEKLGFRMQLSPREIYLIKNVVKDTPVEELILFKIRKKH